MTDNSTPEANNPEVQLKKILVVDDEKFIEYYNNFLTKENFDVTSAINPKEAIEAASIQKFDLIITDIKNPMLSEATLIKDIRQQVANKDTPILFCTKYQDAYIKKLLQEFSHTSFFEKPFQKKYILQAIKNIIDGQNKNSKIDIKFINPILHATINTLSTFAGIKPIVGKPSLKKQIEPSGDISGLVKVESSSFVGNISLSFTESCFLKIVSHVFKTDYREINQEIEDFVAEMLNIIFGQSKKVLNENGMDLNQVIPSVINKKSHTIKHPDELSILKIPFTCECGSFHVEVCGQSGKK
jgi:chemotaxis protein CheX